MTGKEIILLVLILSLLGALIYLVSFYYSDGNKCIQNPYVYAAQRMGDKMTCSCIVENRPGLAVTFNGSEMVVNQKDSIQPVKLTSINWSSVNFIR